MKKINNLYLLLLVLLTSILSILVIHKVVLAVWIEPTTSPGDTSIDHNFVLNPLTEPLNLGGMMIIDDTVSGSVNPGGTKMGVIQAKVNNLNKTGLYIENPNTSGHAAHFEGNVMINGSLKLNGRNVGVSYWDHTDFGSFPSRLYYNEDEPRVGIGTSYPDYPLHISDNNNTAVFNIDNEGTKLWTGTRLARDGSEEWFIGMNDSSDNLLFRVNNLTDRMILDQYGNLNLDGGISIGDISGNQYMQIDYTSTNPPSSDCNSNKIGRMILDIQDQELYVCSSNLGVAEWYITGLIKPKK